MISQCPNCNAVIDYKSPGGWFNYANGLGCPDEKCPNCGGQMPTGRRFWNDLSKGDKMRVYSKALFWIPVGMVIAVFGAYIYLTHRRSAFGLRDPALTEEQAVGFFNSDPVPVLLFAFVASLSGNITALKVVIRSKSVRFRGWGP